MDKLFNPYNFVELPHGYIDSFSGKYRFLSNFCPVNIEYQGIEYASVEHAFQAAKSIDRNERLKIAAAKSPAYAKRLGRKLKLRDDWESIKFNVMTVLLSEKFSVIPLMESLEETGRKYLIEGNSWQDVTYGACERVPAWYDKDYIISGGQKLDWYSTTPHLYGYNRLGKILMLIREAGPYKVLDALDSYQGTGYTGQ